MLVFKMRYFRYNIIYQNNLNLKLFFLILIIRKNINKICLLILCLRLERFYYIMLFVDR